MSNDQPSNPAESRKPESVTESPLVVTNGLKLPILFDKHRPISESMFHATAASLVDAVPLQTDDQKRAIAELFNAFAI